ncbi:MAG: ribosome assembly RNA-binding protein YhbY [Gammaproteobacteria bacterium]
MPLSQKQKRHLKQLAHDKKPVVMVGAAGLTESVMNEIDSSIAHHELIKVKLNVGDREAKQQMAQHIAATLAAELVQTIGHVAVYYRAADKPSIILPRA